MKQKILVIGSGFNLLATAYLLKKKNYDVTVLFENNIKGVLGSVKIEEENFDLGYQFFDGLDVQTSTFIREMFYNKDLQNLEYGASTYSNNYFYEDHAIPYWPAYGRSFVTKAFLFYLKNFFKTFFLKQTKKKYNNLAEFYNELPPNINEIITNGCLKNFQISPEYLSVEANNMSTITSFRQTLFGDKMSNFLKNSSKYFDRVLASRRKNNPNLENISLYPKGKNMEYIADKLIDRLKNDNVIFKQKNFNEIDISKNENDIIINGENFNKVIITANLSNTKRIFKLQSQENFEHFISQAFIYFSIKNLDYNFQYTQINDINLYCSRISNCSLYSKITKKKNKVLIAEIPLQKENKLWFNDKELANIAWNEIKACGIVKKDANYETVKILKIPKTFTVTKINFFNHLNDININLKNKYKEKIDFIGQGIFTRHLFVKELLEKYE